MKYFLPLIILLYCVTSLADQNKERSEQGGVDARLAHLSKSQLKKHLQYLQPFSEYRDQKLEAYVTKVGERVLAQSAHAGRKYAFIIRDNPQPGASVIGIPVVYIDRGLFMALNSEAELAGVIGHEIGHNVGQHIAESRRKQIGSSVLATLASILAGNSSVGNAIATQNQVSFSKYRRAAELEADQFGASYMYKAGYEPTALISGLSQVFDVSKFVAGVGANTVTHHGLRASHPREDRRLQRVIDTAGELPPGESIIGRDEYRDAVEGLIFGPSYAKVNPKGFKRYSNETLGITFLRPETWSFELKGSKIILKDADKTVQMKIEIERTVDKKQSSLDAIKAKYPNLLNPEKIHRDSQRDLGTLGAVPAQRVALAKVARNTFHFQGIAKNNVITAKQDATFVGIIRSFRRMNPKDKTSTMVTKLYYERLEPGQSFSSLARQTKGFDGQDVETALRVLNGYYPKGEAEPGTWIKKLRKEKLED